MNGNFSIVVFAESVRGHFAVAYESIMLGLPSTDPDLGLDLIVQEEPGNNGQARLRAEQGSGSVSLRATILSPFPDSGTGAVATTTSWTAVSGPLYTTNLRLPTNGTCVAILTGESSSGNFARKFFIFPSIFSDELGTTFGGDEVTNVDVIKFERIVIIRECLFKAVLYIWPQ